MPSFTSAILALATTATLASAHGFVKSISINGQSIPGFDITSDYYQTPRPDRVGWYTTATDTGYVEPAAYAQPNIICHRDAQNAALTATIAAGDQISLHWNTWPDGHKGPVLDYLAPCGSSDCSTVDKTSLKFFKFAEAGLVDGSVAPSGQWASDAINSGNGYTWTTTIPATLAPGNYVLRHEIIALHSAFDPNGAQNYPQCINLKVTGSGTESPAGVPATSLYSPQDPGILFNIYQQKITSYTIPGPAVAIGKGASSGGGGQASPTGSATPTATPTATAKASGTATATGTAAAQATQTGKSKGKACKSRRRRRHARQLAAAAAN